jgi:hypothetical protein
MKVKLIGLYELITGLFGVILLLFKLFSNFNSFFTNLSIFFSFFLGIILFAGLAYAGYALLNDLKNGHKYSLYSQILQVVAIKAGTIQYLYSGAAFLFLNFQQGINLKFQMTVIDYGVYKLVAPVPASISIYIVPLVFILLLSIRRKD